MKLDPGEHSILATFPTSNKARAAMRSLHEAGIRNIQLDRISRFREENNTHYNNPVAGQAVSLTGLTAQSAGAIGDQDTGVLVSADPTASGVGMAYYGVAGGQGFMLTVVTNTQKLNQALKLIRENGGQV